jgi:hypothetical protein
MQANVTSFGWGAEIEDGGVELNVSLLGAWGNACLTERRHEPFRREPVAMGLAVPYIDVQDAVGYGYKASRSPW